MTTTYDQAAAAGGETLRTYLWQRNERVANSLGRTGGIANSALDKMTVAQEFAMESADDRLRNKKGRREAMITEITAILAGLDDATVTDVERLCIEEDERCSRTREKAEARIIATHVRSFNSNS